MLKLAALSAPRLGGTFSVVRNLREGLRAHDITLRWIAAGPLAVRHVSDPLFESAHAFGEVVAAEEKDPCRQAKALEEYLVREQYHGLILDSGHPDTNLVRHMTSKCLRIMIVHGISPGIYQYTQGVRDYVHWTVAVSPRAKDDLVKDYHFSIDRTGVIPNGIDCARFQNLTREQKHGELRVLYLGRISDEDKGVFWLPDIAARLDARGCNFILSVAGDGAHLSELRRRSENIRQVRFLGGVKAEDVPNLLAANDIILVTSRYESSPVGLMEGMAAGCVPVASKIQKATDFIVDDARTGFLFPVGDTEKAAAILYKMSCDRDLLQRTSAAARDDAIKRFSLENMAAEYAKVIREIQDNPPPVAKPLPWSEWASSPYYKRSLQSYLPEGFKNTIREWREKLGR